MRADHPRRRRHRGHPAHCRATILEEPLAISDRVCAVELHVDELQDHGQPRFAIEAGVRWHWTDEEAERRDGEIRAHLRALADRTS